MSAETAAVGSASWRIAEVWELVETRLPKRYRAQAAGEAREWPWETAETVH